MRKPNYLPALLLWALASLALCAVAGNGVTGYALFTFTEGSTPATPGTGEWNLGATSAGLVVVDDAGTPTVLGAVTAQSLAPLQWGMLSASTGSAVTMDGVGLLSDPVVADDASAYIPVEAFDSVYFRQQTAASGQARWQTTAVGLSSGSNLYFSAAMYYPDLTVSRYFVGFCDHATAPIDGDASTNHVFGIGYSSVTDSTNYVVIHNDNAGVDTRTDTGVAITNEAVRFEMLTDDDGVTWDWSIYGHGAGRALLGSGTVSANLPTVTVDMFAIGGVEATTAATKLFYTAIVIVQTGWGL